MKPILKYPGAKWSLSSWIIQHMPKHTVYLEPYCGSAAVFFNKTQSPVETLNDVDGNIVNFFRVLREHPEELARLIYFTPWSRQEFDSLQTSAAAENYMVTTGNHLEDARRFLVRMWGARGGKTSDRNSWRHDIQGRKGQSAAKEWNRLPEIIKVASDRLKDAQIDNQPALKIIQRYAFHEVLIYADPPYPLSTRHGRMYKHEMTDADHLEVLEVLNKHPGPVLLSGYACDLYDSRLRDWTRKTVKAQAEGGVTREEVLWINPTASESLHQLEIFGGVNP